MALNLGGRIDDFGDGFDCTAQAEVDPEGPSKRDRTAANTVLGEQHVASTGGVTRLSEQFKVENRMREIRWEEERMRWKKKEDEMRMKWEKEEEEERMRWKKKEDEMRMKWEKEEEEDRRRYWEKQKQLLQMICVIYFGGKKVVDNSPLAGTELASPAFLEQELVEEKCGMDNSPLAGTELASPAFLEQELVEEKCGMDNSPLAGTELAGTGCLHSPVDELNMDSPVFLEQELDEEHCCDTGEDAVDILLRVDEQLTDGTVVVMPKAKGGPWGLENMAIEPGNPVVPGRVHRREPEYVLHSLARGSEEEPQFEDLVSSGQFTGETIWVKPFKAKEAYACSLARVPFSMGGMQWEEKVAVDSECSEEEGEILYCLNIRSERGLKLITYVNKMEEEAVVNRVTTRSEAKEKKKQEAEVVLVVEKEKPIVKALVVGDHANGIEKMDEFEIVVEDGSSSPEQDLGLEGSRGDSITGGFVEELMVVFERKSSIMRKENEKEIAREEMEHRLSGRTTLEKVFLAEQPAEELQDKVVFQELVLRANALEQVKQKTSRRERKMKQKWQGKSVMQVLAQQQNCQSECSRKKRQTGVGEEKTELEGLGAREEEVKLEDFGLELNFLGIKEEEEVKLEDFGLELNFLGIKEEEEMLKDLGVEKELYLSKENQVKSESVNIRETETLLELESAEEASLGTVAEQGYHAEKMKEGVCKRRKKMKRIQKWTKLTQVELGLGDMPEKLEMETEIAVPGVGTEQINSEKTLVIQKQLVVAEPGDRNNADSSRSVRHDRENADSNMSAKHDRENVNSSMAERKVEEKGDNTQTMTVGLGSNRAKAEAVELENLCIRDEKVEKESYVSELEAEEKVKPVSVSSERKGIGVDGRDEQLKQEKHEWESRDKPIGETRYNEKTRSREKDPLGKSWRKRMRKQQKEKFFVRTGVSNSRVENPSVKIMAEESDLCLRASRKELVVVRARQKMVKFKQARGKGDPKVRETVTELSWSKVTDSGKTDSETRQLSRSLRGKPAERQQLWLGENNSWTRGGDVLAGYSSTLLFFTVVHALGVVNLEEGNLEAIMQWTVSWIIMLCYLLIFFGRSVVSGMFCTSLREGAEKDSFEEEEEREETESSKAGEPNYDEASWLFKRWRFTEAGRTVLAKSKDREQEAARTVVVRRKDETSREAARTVLDRRKDRQNENDQLKQTSLLKTCKLMRTKLVRTPGLFFNSGEMWGEIPQSGVEMQQVKDGLSTSRK